MYLYSTPPPPYRARHARPGGLARAARATGRGAAAFLAVLCAPQHRAYLRLTAGTAGTA